MSEGFDRTTSSRRTFLDRGGRVPVAGFDEPDAHPNVPRRLADRLGEILAADAPRDAVGVLLHGPPRIGKSTLAARTVATFAETSKEARTVVLHGPFSEAALLDAVSDALGEKARERLDRYRLSPPPSDELDTLLIDLLDRFTGEERPLLVVLDRVGPMLRSNDSPPRRLKAESLWPVTLLLRALARTRGQAAAVVTGRSTFTVPDRGRDLTDLLTPIEIGLPDPEVARDLVSKGLASKGLVSKGRAASGAATDADSGLGSGEELEDRLLRVSLGHPGLVDLLTRTAVVLPAVTKAALGTLESYLDGRGEVPEDEIPEVAGFFESLIFERLLLGLKQAERDLLRLSTSFETPAPLAVVEEFARRFDLLDDSRPADGGLEASRLADLGLWDFLPVDGRVRVVPNPVARQRAGRLDDEERPAVAMHLIQLYVDAWLPTEETEPEAEPSLQLARLAVHAGDPQILHRVLPRAIELLRGRQLSSRAVELGEQALDLLGSSRFQPTSDVWLAMAELLFSVGADDRGASMLARARGLNDRGPLHEARFRRLLGAAEAAEGRLEEAAELLGASAEGFEAEGRPWDRAAALDALGDVHLAAGDLELALEVRRRQLAVIESLGNEPRRRISVLGHLGSVLSALDRDDEAMGCHETALEAAEALGDEHLVAAVRGEVARLLADRGELDRATEAQRLRLRYFERAGDASGRAHALWSSARIELQRGRIDAATNLLVDAYHIHLERDQAEGIGRVGLDYGQVLWAAGMMGEARLILERSISSFRRLGDTRSVEQAQSILEELTTAS